MIELYRGAANTWECDEMGHMNVRFYVAKMMEGLAVLSHHIGLPQSFRPNSPSTLLPKDQHIRFLNEVHPGRPIFMRGGILDVQESGATVYQELIHADSGKPAATYRTRIRHVATATERDFPWNRDTRHRLEELVVSPDPKIGPRSIEFDDPVLPDTETTRAKTETLGVPVIGQGAVPIEHCDSFGRMKPEFFIGRVSDSVPNLMATWRDDVARATEASGERVVRNGGAVLEYRLAYRHWPRAGDLFEVRTGLGRVGEKVHGLVHWIVDPVSGRAYCTSEAVAVTFDLDTRKIIPTNPHHMRALEARAVKGLAI